MNETQRRVWSFLVVLALFVGVNVGLSFGVRGYWLDPYAATFAALAVLVTTVSAYLASR